LKVLIACIGLAAVPAVAQAEIFMLVPGVQGDATAKGHEKWIRVSSLDWEVEADTAWTASAGASIGKPKSRPIELVLPTGAWSQQLLRLIAMGKSFPNVVLDSIASDGRPLYRMTLEGFFLRDYRLANLPATPLPQDHVSAVFKRVKIEYYTVGANGSITTHMVDWDVTTGAASTSP
jgi:type VI protein secretion system component Hcp